MGEDDRRLGGMIRQVMHPANHLPYFRDNQALREAQEISKQLLDSDEIEFNFDMLINKPAGDLHETPWHQDFAYFQMPFVPAHTPVPNRTLQFWIALDDTDVANGCMHFIPTAFHSPSLEHYIAGGKPTDEGRLLATRQIDKTKAVACPLKAGGCTVHFDGTPHFTPGNVTKERDRRAYIINFLRGNGSKQL